MADPSTAWQNIPWIINQGDSGNLNTSAYIDPTSGGLYYQSGNTWNPILSANLNPTGQDNYTPPQLTFADYNNPTMRAMLSAGYQPVGANTVSPFGGTSIGGVNSIYTDAAGNYYVQPSALANSPMQSLLLPNIAKDSSGNYVTDPRTGAYKFASGTNMPELLTEYRNSVYQGGGDFITNALDQGAGVMAMLGAFGLGAATGFGGALGSGTAGLTGAGDTELVGPLGGQYASDVSGAAAAGGGAGAGSSVAGGGTAAGGSNMSALDNLFQYTSDTPLSFDSAGNIITNPTTDLLSQYTAPLANTGFTIPGYGVNLADSSTLLSGAGSSSSLWDTLSQYLTNNPTSAIQKLLFGQNAQGQPNLPSWLGGSGASTGLLNTALQEAPGLMALDYAKNQPGIDLTSLNSILSSLQGNQNAIVKAATDPLQANIAAGYGDLLQSQAARGIRGSSFGDTDIANYLATTGNALANAGANAAQGSLALQGNLAGNIANLQNQAQQIKNNLYGRAFSVLGQGLNPTPTFNLSGLTG